MESKQKKHNMIYFIHITLSAEPAITGKMNSLPDDSAVADDYIYAKFHRHRHMTNQFKPYFLHQGT